MRLAPLVIYLTFSVMELSAAQHHSKNTVPPQSSEYRATPQGLSHTCSGNTCSAFSATALPYSEKKDSRSIEQIKSELIKSLEIDKNTEPGQFIIKFGASWCPPCNATTPHFKKVAEHFLKDSSKSFWDVSIESEFGEKLYYDLLKLSGLTDESIPLIFVLDVGPNKLESIGNQYGLMNEAQIKTLISAPKIQALDKK